jgi:PPOX class probable F420-dependent enzyme
MFDETARAFLQQRLIARLSTIDSAGYPHTVPVWFMLDGDELLFISDRGVRKTRNALANPKGAAVIGGDPDDATGYLIQGDLTVEADTAHNITNRMVDRYQDTAEGDLTKAAWKEDDIVVIRLQPKMVIKVR